MKVRERRKTRHTAEHCKLQLEAGQVTDLAIRQTSPLSGIENEYTLENSKAFRYVYITHEPGVQIGEVSMQYEYLPEEYRGTFRCNDEELNRIWEVGAYTMHLTTVSFLSTASSVTVGCGAETPFRVI